MGSRANKAGGWESSGTMVEVAMQPTITGPTIECRQCGKPNSLDSRFCKSCGAPVPEDDLAAARQRRAEFLDEGIRLLADGRNDEARLVAEAAIASDPEDPRAHAFLGDCLEQADDIAGALASYEKVVELSPDSALDKIRVAHLRKLLAARSLEIQQPPDRRKAILGGTLAMILVGSLGTVLAVLNASPPSVDKAAGQASGSLSQQGSAEVRPPIASETPAATERQPATVEPSSEAGSQPQPSTGTAPDSRGTVPAVPRAAGSVLPYPRPDGSVAQVGGNTPMVPPIEGSIRVTPEGATRAAPEPRGGANKSPDPDPAPAPEVTENKKPPASPGIIEITPSKGQNKPRVGGSEPVEPGRAETLLRVARQQYLMGNYAAAADAYVKALADGAEPGITNQRLAQSYEKLGRRSEASAAYGRAIRVFESEPNPTPARRAALEACRQAAKVLGG